MYCNRISNKYYKGTGIKYKIRKTVIVTYVIVVTLDTEDHFQRTTENLIDTMKNIDLIINENKTKFITALRRAFTKCNNIKKI